MKFKNAAELISFILMNLLGWPFTWIIAGYHFGWVGFIVSIILFYISFKIWKYITKQDCKLSINPGFSFGNKRWNLF
jgi:hypothetical protein